MNGAVSTKDAVLVLDPANGVTGLVKEAYVKATRWRIAGRKRRCTTQAPPPPRVEPTPRVSNLATNKHRHNEGQGEVASAGGLTGLDGGLHDVFPSTSPSA